MLPCHVTFQGRVTRSMCELHFLPVWLKMIDAALQLGLITVSLEALEKAECWTTSPAGIHLKTRLNKRNQLAKSVNERYTALMNSLCLWPFIILLCCFHGTKLDKYNKHTWETRIFMCWAKLTEKELVLTGKARQVDHFSVIYFPSVVSLCSSSVKSQSARDDTKGSSLLLISCSKHFYHPQDTN